MGDNEAVSSPRSVAILGSTGSIGTQALDVISRNVDRFTVAALSAGGNVDLVAQQAVATLAPLVAVAVALLVLVVLEEIRPPERAPWTPHAV